jgi:Ca-activated chloride channel family protein
MNEFIANFHFLRPWAFMLLILLAWSVWQLKKMAVSQSGWQKFLPAHLSSVLLSNEQNTQQLSSRLPFFIGLLAIVALAGPSWQKLPQPVYEIKRGSILLMDMSYSMLATDLAPNRQTRARYKAVDLLNELNEGDIGLIAYAGDAFAISPLTKDINNIELLLASLTPDIMPEPGSNPIAALALADEMLMNAGHVSGDVYWFTDGVESEDVEDLSRWLATHQHKVKILGVGTAAGAPIKMSNGELLKDGGQIIIPKLNAQIMQGLAQKSKGKYQNITADSSDIKALIETNALGEAHKEDQSQQHFGDQWQEAGPYLLLILLPLVLSYFRRGVLLTLSAGLFVTITPPPAQAGLWQDLWQTSDQQASEKFASQDYQGAAEQFSLPMWQGSSHYKAGNYQQALEAFQQEDSAESLYNQGNALAKLSQLDQAIKAYEQALSINPELSDAQKNKELLEQLKQQQQNQENDSQQEQQEQSQQNQDEQQQNQQQQDQTDQQQQNQQQQDQTGQQQQNQQQQDQTDQPQQNQQQQDQTDQPQQNQQQQSQDEHQQQEEHQSQQNSEEQKKQQTEEQQLTAGQQNQQPLSEEQQKHAQMLKKVTDDPYQLLRNKMQYEYQKRQQQRQSKGVTKSW